MILTPQGVPFHPVVVIGLGKNLLFKSVLAHCGGAPIQCGSNQCGAPIQCSFSSKSFSGKKFKEAGQNLMKLVKNQVKYQACYQLDMAFGVFSDQLIGSLGIAFWSYCTLDSDFGLISSVFSHFTGFSNKTVPEQFFFLSNLWFVQTFAQFTKYANSYLNSFIGMIFFVVSNLGWDLFRSVQHRLHYILFVRLCPGSNWQFSDFNFGFGNLTKKLEKSKISIIV